MAVRSISEKSGREERRTLSRVWLPVGESARVRAGGWEGGGEEEGKRRVLRSLRRKDVEGWGVEMEVDVGDGDGEGVSAAWMMCDVVL